MDFWFKNNLRASTIPAPVMTACKASVSGNAVTVTGSATDAAGTVSSYRVVLNGATAINDPAAGSGASFSIGYALANGYYSGSVTATDSGTGRTSAACDIAQFLVGPVPAVQPPAGLAVTGRTASSIALSWTAASGATGYNVYRNGTKVTPAPVSTTSYNSTGLTASTSYNFQASSVNSSGAESALSAAVTGTTTSGFVCTATTSSNYAHVQAGRAHDSGAYALANGSNQNMGLDNTFYSQTLAQTSAGYYVIGTCP
jgi:poly(3-hydroxybutyrate) depolymerase